MFTLRALLAQAHKFALHRLRFFPQLWAKLGTQPRYTTRELLNELFSLLIPGIYC